MLAARATRAADACVDLATQRARTAYELLQRQLLSAVESLHPREKEHATQMILPGLEPAIFGSEDQRLIH